MRILVVSVLMILSTSAFAGESQKYARWIRITASEDQTQRSIQICNFEQTKCAKLGKKNSYSVAELSRKSEEIKKIRNRTIAGTYALAFLSIVASPIAPIGPTLVGGRIYPSYSEALEYMEEIELASETTDLGVADILVESAFAVDVIRAALDTDKR